MSVNKPIQLGLCCMNTTLKEQKPPIYSSRRMAVKTILSKGIDELKRRIILNLQGLKQMLEWNEQNGIKVFRISSEIFPHKTNPAIPAYNFDFAKELLKEVGDYAKQHNHRLTIHPGQYNVIGTPTEKTFQQTLLNLDYQAEMLDLMGLDHHSVMVIHGGGVYGDKGGTIKRWCENFYRLPKRVQKRLVIENCEKSYSVEDCLRISDMVNIPVVFDTHHYDCYVLLHKEHALQPATYYLPAILASWKKRNIKPKFHVSEQCCGGRTGKHSDYIDNIPTYLLTIPNKFNVHIDIMIEAKKKELSIQKLYAVYPFLNCVQKYTSEIIAI